MTTSHDSVVVKLILIGDEASGKTGLLNRFHKNIFDCPPTSGIIDFKIKSLDIDGKSVQVQVWDTAGGLTSRLTTQSYYKAAHGFILTYDITDVDGFEKLSNFMQDIKDLSIPNAPIILLATKSDLESERKITTARGKEFSNKFNLHFFETSAKDDVNVVEAFNDIVLTTLQFVNGKSTPLVLDSENTAQSKCCF